MTIASRTISLAKSGTTKPLVWNVANGTPPNRLTSTAQTIPVVAASQPRVVQLALTVRMSPDVDPISVRLWLDETLADLNLMSQNLRHAEFEMDPHRTGEQAGGIYRYSLNTIASEQTNALANIIAVLLTKKVGKNTVRVVVTSANETLCEIAA